MSHLYACPSCERHVRSDEVRCPFCDLDLADPPAPRPAPRGHLGRAALLALGAVLVGGAANCGEDTTDDTTATSSTQANASSGNTTTTTSATTTTGGGDGGSGEGGVGGAGGSGMGIGGIAPPYGHAPLPDAD